MKRDIKKLLKQLKSLMEDQKDTPEGELASQIYQQLKEKYPNVDEVEENFLCWVNRFKNEDERDLWIWAARAHDIEVYRFAKCSSKLLKSEGNEIDIIIEKAEWENVVKQFNKMKIQLLRAILNRIWPQICRPSDDKDLEEDMMAITFFDHVKPFKKCLEQKTIEGIE